MNGRSRRVFAACVIGVTSMVWIGLATSWDAPPRFDGAGYVILARSLHEGSGYRSIDHPDRPRHAHFPPGYPIALSVLRTVAGDDEQAIHLFSALCTIAATFATYLWFTLLLGRQVAFWLGLTLATNWVWTRSAGAIQSEPLFEVLGQCAILIAWKARRRDASWNSVLLGFLLGWSILTRHVAIGLAGAVIVDLAISRRWRNLLITTITTIALILPWIGWIVWLAGRSEGGSQAELLSLGEGGLISRVCGQAIFYAQRLPDQLIGPFIEVATVFRRSPVTLAIANVWGLAASALVLLGWTLLLKSPRRRLAGMIPLITLGLLIIWPFTEAGRFLVPLLPCIILGVIEGGAGLLGLIRPSRSLSGRRGNVAVLLLALSLPYSTYSLFRGRSKSLEETQGQFNAACAWIAGQNHKSLTGPILTRHPGEVYLLTGRHALDVSTRERAGSRDATPEEIADIISRFRVAYLIIDDGRYANAPTSPLARYVNERPESVHKVWPSDSREGPISIYAIGEHR